MTDTQLKIIHINSMDSPELRIYQGLSEPQLLHYYEPEPGLFIAESAMIIERALDAGYEAESLVVEDTYLDGQHAAEDIMKVLERTAGVPVYTASLEMLKAMTGYTITRGIMCAMRRKELPFAKDVLKGASRIVLLEDVMNPTNQGAIFRSAAALGLDAVLLTKGCADPLYRRSSRVSVGTVFQIPWTYVYGDYVKLLKAEGFKVAAMALKDESINLSELNPSADEKIAFLMGSEGPGLKDQTIEACDVTVKIPMAHGVDSLNVAAASAIAFWQIRK